MEVKNTYTYDGFLKGDKAAGAIVTELNNVRGWHAGFGNIDGHLYQGYPVRNAHKKLVGYFEYDGRDNKNVTVKSFNVNDKPEPGTPQAQLIRSYVKPETGIAPVGERALFDRIFTEIAEAMGGQKPRGKSSPRQ